jgi:UDP-GlcNAc:undecaprenyl-phosphate/decaprenyl-phosphate GlcNAc-1-phosphate transferase
MTIVFHYVLPLIIGVVIAWLGLVIFRKLGVMDKPGADLVGTRKAVPTMQGIFVYLAFFVIIAICFPVIFRSTIFRWLFVGTLPIIVFEFIEELRYIGKIKRKIPTIFRLVWHILGAVLAVYVWHFGWQELLIGTYKLMIPQRWFAIFFVIWSIICINAINRFDGIYAQASGVSSIWFLTIFLLIQFVVFGHYTNFTAENMLVLTTVKYLSFTLFAISLISTFVEFKPLWLVRDLGIMFYGFALAYLSVVGWAKIGTLIVALSLVIFDAVRVGLRRIFIMKKNPLKGDYTHLHHRLMGLGRTRKEVRATVWIWSLVMMILILLQGTDRNNKIVIFVMMALVFFWVNYYLFVVKKLPCWLPMKK